MHEKLAWESKNRGWPQPRAIWEHSPELDQLPEEHDGWLSVCAKAAPRGFRHKQNFVWEKASVAAWHVFFAVFALEKNFPIGKASSYPSLERFFDGNFLVERVESSESALARTL